MKSAFATALAGALTLCASLALAQEPEIVIEGGQQEEAIREFIGTASAAVAADDQLAMWQGDICPGILGVRRDQAQAFIDRVALRAYQLGVQTGASGCQPNVFIFFAPDANAFSRQLFEDDRSLFAYFYEENISTRGHAALEDFLSAPRPVRWWHVTRRTTAEGMHLASNNVRRGPRDEFKGAQVVRSEGSRLRQAIRQEFARAIIVVDASQTAGFPLPAVADYVAMVTLAQIEPDAALSGHATILNLFTAPDEARPTELTAWDIAYLQGLYHATPEAASTTLQFGEMTHRMERELVPQD